MININKIFLTLLTAFFLFSGYFSLAAKSTLEALPESIINIPRLIEYLFRFGMIIAASLAILVLVYGAFRYMISGGNPGTKAEAKDRMYKAVIGLIILLASWLIIGYINPELRMLKIRKLPSTAGVFLWNGQRGEQSKEQQAPLNSGDIQKERDAGFTHIRYKCKTRVDGEVVAVSNEYPLLVFFYPEKNLGDKDNATVHKLPCVEPDQEPPSVALSRGKSYEIRFQTPGVYLYKKAGCPYNAYRSPAFTSNQSDLGEFNKQVNCVEIINDLSKNIHYGAMLHEFKNFEAGSRCLNDILFKTIKNPVPATHSSMTIFKWNPSWSESGDGAVFYSHPFSEYKGGGCARINSQKPNQCAWRPEYAAIENVKNPFDTHPGLMEFDYTGTNIPEEEQKKCEDRFHPQLKPTFRQCPGSMKILGNYLVILYSLSETVEDEMYCQVFDKNAENLNNAWITQKKYGGLFKVQIIPVK